MIRIIKSAAALAVILLACANAAVMAQSRYADTNKASSGGVSADDSYQKWFLSGVRNNRTDIIHQILKKEPWKAQDEINVYQDADKKASISLFCVGVDMGNIEAVQTMIYYGFGKNDMCRIQLFTTEMIDVSKIEETIKGKYEQTVSKGGIFGGAATRPNAVNLYTATTNAEAKTVVKSYFASPLDFASGKMFDYLWGQGFRSENLLDMKILAEALKNNKQEVISFIADNISKVKGKKGIGGDESLKKLIQTARWDHTSIAFSYLTGGYDDASNKNFASAYELKKSLEKLTLDFENYTRGGVKFSSDTLGYTDVKNTLNATHQSTSGDIARVKREEARAAEHISKVKNDFYKTTGVNVPGNVKVDGSSALYVKRAGDRVVLESENDETVYRIERPFGASTVPQCLIKTGQDYYFMVFTARKDAPEWKLQNTMKFTEKEMQGMKVTDWYSFTTPIKAYFGVDK